MSENNNVRDMIASKYKDNNVIYQTQSYEFVDSYGIEHDYMLDINYKKPDGICYYICTLLKTGELISERVTSIWNNKLDDHSAYEKRSEIIVKLKDEELEKVLKIFNRKKLKNERTKKWEYEIYDATFSLYVVYKNNKAYYIDTACEEYHLRKFYKYRKRVNAIEMIELITDAAHESYDKLRDM